MVADARLPRRLLAVLVPVVGAGSATLIAAAWAFTRAEHSPGRLAAVALLLVAAILSERFQVPLEGAPAGTISLLYVFTVATIVLFGWHAGALLAAIATLTQLAQHRPLVRVAYNASVYAIAAAVAGAAASRFDADVVSGLVAAVAVAAFVDYWVNMVLTTLVVSVDARRPFAALIASNTRGTVGPFTLMASTALMLVVLWQRSPVLSAALVGPLVAISLYQRSTHRELRAMRLALTDALTGLGNQRHFHERLQRELFAAEAANGPLSLCLIDLDDFKHVNDNHGHPAGDRILCAVAARLRQGGEAFRLGGDEFAVLLPGQNEPAAFATASAIVQRISELELEGVERMTASAGVASFPIEHAGRDELIRVADSALYWAKEHGKNRVHAYQPEAVELVELDRMVASGADRARRLRSAVALAAAADARDGYAGPHSARVSELAVRIARRMCLRDETVELTRVAASLHDVGKLAIPEEILRKPGPLSDAERLLVERHPQIGYRMLQSLGAEPVADWVLHHHERWDATGYPERLPGEEIALGARIILVADAFDAMTSDRVYRAKLTQSAAITELERCAGTQFDPDVVAAALAELDPTRRAAAAAKDRSHGA